MKHILFPCFLSFFLGLKAQNRHHEIALLVDNDLLTLRDEYYTSSISISYSKQLQNSFLFAKTEESNLQLRLALSNHIYTPTNLRAFNTASFDRPYAGWSFITAELKHLKLNRNQTLTLETGITGPESQSGNLQIWLHDTFDFKEKPSWAEEIDFKWLFNLKYSLAYDILVRDGNVLQTTMTSSIGTKDIFAEGYLHYFFGKLDDSRTSVRNGALASTGVAESFFTLSAGYKYVVHNTLIEGGLLNNTDSFTLTATPHIFTCAFGGVIRKKRGTLRLNVILNSNETALSSWHLYTSLGYSFSF